MFCFIIRRMRYVGVFLSLGLLLLVTTACGEATVDGPTSETSSLPASYGPLLSNYYMQHSAIGTSEVAEGQMGYSVAMGDFNGDGRMDLVMGAPRRETGWVFIRQSVGQEYLMVGTSLNGLRLRGTGEDDFGWSLAVGDFNGDGRDDLAIGAPRRDVDGHARAGQAFVLYGSGVGLTYAGFTTIMQGQDGLVESDDLLGWSLAAGDFNGDGYDDLAVGAPGETYNGQAGAGAVLIRWGSSTGLNRAYSPTLIVHPEPQAHSQFGYALASGIILTTSPLQGHYKSDLVVSSPFRDQAAYSASERKNITYSDAGEVMFWWGQWASSAERAKLTAGSRLYNRLTDEPQFGKSLAVGNFNGGSRPELAVGTPHYLDRRGAVAIVQPYPGPDVLYTIYPEFLAISETGDEFGAALAAGDFDDDGFDDLSIGTPLEDWGGVDAGMVHILFGSADTLLTRPDAYYLGQGDRSGGGGNRVGAREGGDRFGAALAAGDIDSDGAADLLIGSPLENIRYNEADYTNAGAAFVALSRAPRSGPFDGLWTGTINGDSSSSAPVNITLSDRNNIVAGSATILSPGIIINVAESCAPRNDDDENPFVPDPLDIETTTTPDAPRRAATGGTLTIRGYAVEYDLTMTVAPDGQTMTAVFALDIPFPANACVSDRTFTVTLTKQ
ncbi:MAG: FG-GAP repeat protein [Chloroflexi bacterium]|nr:FG-GAP repeat protein [Chloroflexota bacterium]